MTTKKSVPAKRLIRAFRKRIALAVREAERAATRAETAAAKVGELVKLFEILSIPLGRTVPAAEPVETTIHEAANRPAEE